ncbi:unnamed protein product [Gongylonema pulchrum]|uniref:Uncharacterized protein n=1 Tax=Gongylonema pulchrum TaxID=637853 RepID=A0A3P7PDW0_9BILA|nr:unnamed protein product [Gongylonema pulchrum]
MEEEKNRFLHTVDFISQQQTELETLVVDLEKSLGLGDWTEMAPIGLPDPGISTHADVKRQEIYCYVENFNFLNPVFSIRFTRYRTFIYQMTELQKVSNGGDEQAETVEQIAQILRRQLDALQWIDEQTGEMN